MRQTYFSHFLDSFSMDEKVTISLCNCKATVFLYKANHKISLGFDFVRKRFCLELSGNLHEM